MNASASACAIALIEVMPMIMRVMREEVRRHGAPEMSLPQFRTLAFLGSHEGAALTEVAAFLGLTLPSASKLVDGVVRAKLVLRVSDSADRRRVSLRLSAAGRRKFEAIVRHARELFARRLEPLPAAERRRLLDALAILRELFEPAALPRAGQPKASADGSARRKPPRRETARR